MSKICDQCGGTFKVSGGAFTKHIKKCPGKADQAKAAEVSNNNAVEVSALLYSEEMEAKDEQDPIQVIEEYDPEGIHETLKGAGQKDRIAPTIATNSIPVEAAIILQLEQIPIPAKGHIREKPGYRNYHIFDDVGTAYAWYAENINNPTIGIHSVFWPGQAIKVFFDIDAPHIGDETPEAHLARARAVAFDAVNALMSLDTKKHEQFDPYKPNNICDIAECVRPSKVGIHIRFYDAWVKDKATYKVLLDEVMRKMPEASRCYMDENGCPRPYLDKVSGISLRMPGTYKNDEQDGSGNAWQLVSIRRDRESFEAFQAYLLTRPGDQPKRLYRPGLESTAPIVAHANIGDAAQDDARGFFREHHPQFADCQFNKWRFIVKAPYECLICKETHHKQNGYIVLGNGGYLGYKCFFADGKTHVLRHRASGVELPPPRDDYKDEPGKVWTFAYYLQFRPRLGKPTEHDIDEVRAYFKATVFHIVDGGDGYFMTKNISPRSDGRGSTMYYKKVNPSDLPFSSIYKPGHFKFISKDDKKEHRMYDLHIENMNDNAFSETRFLPYLTVSTLPPQIFNIFAGFDYPYQPRQSKHGEWPQSIARIMEHKRDIICAGNAYAFEYYCRWIAQLIQAPAQILPISIVIKGDARGVGKSRETAQLEAMVGRAHTLQIADLERLTCNFNSYLENKLLIIGNDMGDKGGYNLGALRSFISEPDKMVEVKGREAYQAQIYARLILTTNHDYTFLFAPGQRRWVALNPIPKMKGNTEYFDALTADIENPEIELEAFNYFANYDYKAPHIVDGVPTPWNWENHPNTEINDAVEMANAEPLPAFLGDIGRGALPYLYAQHTGEKFAFSECDELRFSTADFCEAYLKYYAKNFHKAPPKDREIIKQMRELGFASKRIKKDGRNYEGYILKADQVLETYRKAINNPAYVFDLSEGVE